MQKQPSRGVLRKRCSENMQQISRKTSTLLKSHQQQSNFIEITRVFSCKFAAYFQNTFIFKWLFISENLSRLCREIITTRSRHNANFHQQKSSIHMSWKFPRLTEIPPTADRDLGQAGKYFLTWMHFPGWVRIFSYIEQVQKSIT